MGLINDELRQELLDIAARSTKQTSFSRQLAQQPTIYDRQKAQQDLLQRLYYGGAVTPPPNTPAAAAKQAADVSIVAKLPRGQGFNPAGYYFGISVDFALGPQGSNVPSPVLDATERDEWGLSFGNPLVNPHKSTIYMVRATVSQLRVEPLLGGLILRWVRPTGWAWADGQGVQIPVQVASNPLVVTRLVLSPSTTIVNTGFSVSVVAQYP